ncbi:MAG: gamma-glutamyltransferase [Gemmatimonadetes bacterium]|nr:gamma-glutamyltransferase [Gemmatimonadota bacterium]
MRLRPFFLALLVPLAGTAQERDATSTRGVVVSTSDIASDVGAAILGKGGNAIDAAVATGFALAVTHPSAGNIGGGGFMVIRFADGRSTTIDYREKAPLRSTRTMYLGADGKIDRSLTAAGWLAPGVPGTVRGLALAHQKYGKLPWADVVRPAAELAANGFRVSKGFAESLNGFVRRSGARFPSTREAYGKAGGAEWQEGDTLRLTDLGRSLGAIATDPNAFYTGWIADSIDRQMKANGGIMTKRDLAAYRAVERAPVKGTFLGHEVISMPPPSSGGAVVIQTLNILEALGVSRFSNANDPALLHLRIEAAKRVYRDRARWMGDPDFVKVPVARMISPAYARELARGIDTTKSTTSVVLGKGLITVPADESDETTHYSVVDTWGNAVSNTYTLEGGYGSGVVVRGAGFILNNEMGDFNKKPGETNLTGDIGTPPNLIAPGKRMLSSMSPVIVAKDGQLRLVTGSPGGRTIPNTTLSVVLGVAAFGLTAREAVDLPRLHHQWLPDAASFETGVADDATIEGLKAKGHTIRVGSRQGDAHSIVYDASTKTAYGAADRRTPDSKASAPPQ